MADCVYIHTFFIFSNKTCNFLVYFACSTLALALQPSLCAAAEFAAPTMVPSNKAACTAEPPSNHPMDNNNRINPVNTPKKKVPKCAKKSKTDIWT